MARLGRKKMKTEMGKKKNVPQNGVRCPPDPKGPALFGGEREGISLASGRPVSLDL